MTDRSQIQAILQRSLRAAAPGTDPARLAQDADIREELDLDSMDFLNFVTALHEALGIDIPERDYRHLSTLRTAEEFLAGKVAR